MTKPKPRSQWKKPLLGAEAKPHLNCARCGQPRGLTVCWPYCSTCSS